MFKILKISPLNVLTYTLVFLSIYYLAIDFSIKNIGHTFSLLIVGLIAEFIFSKILKVKYSFNSAIITSLLGVMILFKGFGNDIYIVNMLVIFFSIFGKKILQKYSVNRINPIVLGILVTFLLSLTGIINAPIVGWQGASTMLFGFDIMLPITLLIGGYIMFKFKKTYIILSFLIIFLGLYIINNGFNNIYNIIFTGTIYFYLFFMLIEPKSSPLGKTKQIIFGGFGAIVLMLSLKSGYMAPYILSIFSVNILNFFLNEISDEENSDIRYYCVPCGYIYDEDLGDPDSGIEPGTKFEDIPNDWSCPICGVTKADFIKIAGEEHIKYIKTKILEKKYINLNKNVIELKLEINNKIDSKIGQYISLVYNDKDGDFRRSYSIASIDDNIYTFLIKTNEYSRSSQALMKLEIGSEVKITGIFGNFILKNNKNKKFFIATGTGLAPIINMINNTKKDKILLFGVRNKEDLFYIDKLRKIQSLKIYIYLSAEGILPKDIGNIIYKKGRIDLKPYLINNDFYNNDFYICGNPALITNSNENLEKKGIKNIYFEQF